MPPKIVHKPYDGTIATIYLQNAVKSILLSQRDQVDMVLAYGFKKAPPSPSTLIRWAKEGVPLLPHQRDGGRLQAKPTPEKAKVGNEAKPHNLIYTNKHYWAKATWRRLRKRAGLQGMDFDISYFDLIPPDICPVFGTPIKIGGGRGYEDQKNSPSIDRFDNSKGYTKNNIRIISKRANSLKSDGTLEEMERVLAYMRS